MRGHMHGGWRLQPRPVPGGPVQTAHQIGTLSRKFYKVLLLSGNNQGNTSFHWHIGDFKDNNFCQDKKSKRWFKPKIKNISVSFDWLFIQALPLKMNVTVQILCDTRGGAGRGEYEAIKKSHILVRWSHLRWFDSNICITTLLPNA